MLPDTTTALLIAAVTLVPGFVAQRRGEQTHSKRIEREGLRWTILSLYYSALTYGVLILATAPFGADREEWRPWVQGAKEPWQYALAAAAVLIVALAIAEIERIWVTRDRTKPWHALERWGWRVQQRHAIAGAWDWILGQGVPKFVIVALKSDEEIGGYFGYDSFAAYSTENATDLYIEEVIALDNGWFADQDPRGTERPKTTAGIWIARDEIRSIEFYPAPPSQTEQGVQEIPTDADDNDETGQ